LKVGKLDWPLGGGRLAVAAGAGVLPQLRQYAIDEPRRDRDRILAAAYAGVELVNRPGDGFTHSLIAQMAEL
jgi:hypothetical protein